MKLKWSSISPIADAVLKKYRNDDPTKIKQGQHTKHIYAVYYRPSQRESAPTTGTSMSASEWTTFASEAAFNPKSGWDRRELQVVRDSRLVPVGSIGKLSRTDKVASIVHSVRDAEVVARIQVTVKQSCAGPELYESLRNAKLMSNLAVRKWKVFSPEKGGTGPDSAVIYLCEPLTSVNVRNLIDELKDRLGENLRPLPSGAPLGQQSFKGGISGFALPSKDYCEQKLRMGPEGIGSAGTTIAALIDRLCFRVAKRLSEVENPEEHLRNRGGAEKYLMEFMKKMIADELSWTLT
ncbi:hypothetical protein FMN50_02005 [Rhodobacterales bacterium]|nr:hypothetical protein FMN50_02005 [Rhodobacterales bacterium]